MAEEHYIVTLKRPGGMNMQDMEDYIHDAVTSWRGSLSPEHPGFNIKRESISVRRLTPNRARRIIDGLNSTNT